MADGYERLPEWFWHPTHGLYGHEEPARPGDRTLYVRVDDAAGSPPPTPAPTREQVAAMVDSFVPASPSVMPYFEGIRGRLIDAVMALLSAEPAPPLWTGVTMEPGDDTYSTLTLYALPVPPGTAVEVRERTTTSTPTTLDDHEP